MPRSEISRSTSSVPMKREHTRPVVISPQKPSFLQTIKEGIALGVGSSIGHRIVGAVMGPLHVQQSPLLEKKTLEYDECMEEHDDKAACERFLNASDKNKLY